MTPQVVSEGRDSRLLQTRCTPIRRSWEKRGARFLQRMQVRTQFAVRKKAIHFASRLSPCEQEKVFIDHIWVGWLIDYTRHSEHGA